MTSKEIRDAVLRVRTVAGLSEELRGQVAEILLTVSQPRSVAKGTVWLHEGEHTENKGYILLKGAVGIQKSESPPVECRGPELLGEMMQFNPLHLRTATVVTLEDSVVLRFLWDDFWALTAKQLSASDQEKVKDAVKDLAWRHFVE
jgi:CRP-like cAMP-binding protein